jgi:hypothetical protein
MGEMKTLIATLTLTLVGVSSAHAQIYQPAATRGAVLGAIAGAFVGGHNHDRWAEGALIGGVAGALLGAVVAPQERVYQAPPVVYSEPSRYGHYAPVGPAVSYVESAPMVPQAPPQVVYVESAPRVVYYVSAPPPRVVYVAPRVVGYGPTHYSSSRYYGPSHSGPRSSDNRHSGPHRR